MGWIARWGGGIATAVLALGSVLLALDFLRSLGVVLSMTGVFLYVAAGLAEVRERRTAKRTVSTRLREHLNRSELEPLLDQMARDTQLKKPWRISLYVHGPDASNSWTRRARVSSDAVWATHGRPALPLDEGFVGWAMRFAEAGLEELSILPDPETDWDAYAAVHASRRVEASVLRSLRMRSRSYVAIVRKAGFDGSQPVHIALVFESVVAAGTQATTVDRAVNGTTVDALYRLLQIRDLMESSTAELEKPSAPL